MVDMLNKVIEAIAGLVSTVLSVLPQTPFTFDLGALGAYWKAVNYFIPFNTMATFLAVYLIAVGIWYVSRWALRLAKYIQ